MLEVAFAAAPQGVVVAAVGAVPLLWRAQAAADGFTGAAETTCRVSPSHLLTGLGDGSALAAEAAGAHAMAVLLRERVVTLDARALAPAIAASLLAGMCLRAWRFDRLRTRPAEDAPRIEAIIVLSDQPETEAAWARMAPSVAGALLARDLVSEPSDTLTPAGFVARLAPLRAAGVSIDVIAGPDLAPFGGVCAVGRASIHPPCVVMLRWAGQGGQQGGQPIAFVGKGITFDTGGISIKPAEDMWEMRADMAGAAACAGAMLALALRGSPAAAIAVLPLAENAVGANAYRPGDVLRMLDGSTVQVVDTDAEGRLVLADALVQARRQAPRAIIDLATLTGSIVVALGHEMAGAFDNDASLARAVRAAGAAVGELVWSMPIGARHRSTLESDIADVKHCVDGRGQPDACQAAAFLRDFVGETPWVHLDIAGVESRAEADGRYARGATGFGARLLDRLVADLCEPGG